MIKRNNIWWMGIMGFLLFITQCTKDKTPEPATPVTACDSTKVYFENDVLPILQSNCAKSGCHDAVTHEEGLNLSIYSGAKKIVNAGNANGSEMMEVINETDPDKEMPPPGNTPLTAEQIAVLNQWINDGANNDYCAQDTSNCVSTNMSFATDIAPIINTNCSGCHSGSSPSGGINLSAYAGVSGVASSGKLYNAVAQNGSAQPMPPSSKISDCDISKIKSWVDAGYLDN